MQISQRLRLLSLICGCSCLTCGLLLAQPVPVSPFGSSVPVVQPPIAQPEPPAVDWPDRNPRAQVDVGDGPIPAPMGGGAIESDPAMPRFRLRTNDGPLIIGEFAEDAKIKLKSKFGEIELPLNEVARIESGTDEREHHVTLRNRDRLTGTVTLGSLKLKAEWGEVPVRLKTLKSLESGTLEQMDIHHAVNGADGRSVEMVAQQSIIFRPTIADPRIQPTTGTVTYPSPTAYSGPVGPTRFGPPTRPAPSTRLVPEVE